jgi:chitinase
MRTALLLALIIAPLRCEPARSAQPPEIVLRCPAKDAAFAPGDVIPLKADFRGRSPAVVEFTSNGEIIARDNTPPFAATFRPTSGNYILTAQARDRAGTLVQSPRVIINVRAPEQDEMTDNDDALAMGLIDPAAPIAILVSPVTGTVLCHPSSVQIVADTKGVRSPVVRVEFLIDGASIGTRTAPPFTFTWKHPSVRRHHASVRVFAADGRVGTSRRANLLIID